MIKDEATIGSTIRCVVRQDGEKPVAAAPYVVPDPFWRPVGNHSRWRQDHGDEYHFKCVCA
jgi:hypothetical protein